MLKSAIDRLPQIECNVLLDEFPTVLETRKTVQQLSSGKTPGAGAIPAEVCIRPRATHGRKTDGVVSLYVEEEGYPTRI